MLLYHPFFDPQHCVFRMLRLLRAYEADSIEIQRIRIWDFYLLFPSHLSEARLPKGQTRIRSTVERKRNKYEVLPNPRRAFLRLEPIQNTALAHLSSLAIIDAKLLTEGAIKRTKSEIPQDIVPLIEERNKQDAELISYLTNTFLRTPLHGKDGIKSRTDLFDSRYDLP